MNQQQAKYTIERINTLERRKLETLRDEYTVPAKQLTDAELVDLIVKKKVRIKEGEVTRTGAYHTLALVDVYDFSKFTWKQHMREGHAEAEAKIKAEASRVRDEVMLGDNVEALRLLRAFAGE